MAVTIAQICDAITTVVGTVTTVTRTQSYDQLGEGINSADTPLVQVYWQSLAMAPPGGTDRSTFVAGRRYKQFSFHVDVYGQQRSQLAEDMTALVDVVDDIIDALEAQKESPYFDLAGIRSWALASAERVTFQYADATFVGARLILTVWVY